MKKTNQPKENKMSKQAINKAVKFISEIDKYEMKKNDLVNEIDVLFYDIENIEDQASFFRAILRVSKLNQLQAIKDFIKQETKK
tara:strand:+ start:93 stop:344 length:252 start_codon:yes stop_codon:yes gene_type:complete